ncbi:transglutaminase TgpA family protein [Terrihalobacillus insolitus]|uniref:transglutaminase TgpA family protein n=1 Tax=Terrihalobacillus insolitus TaxID=2950438 RepID=UPI00233FE00E|nr:transglutaminase domain-containing protein [Terrihalobacillus insolitus]MDC3414213.1 transglutaminaseTgpA domain-containing protein [Terrihalobacillus insolitus]
MNWIKRSPAWVLPLVAMILFSSVVGYAAPKLAPQWPDPVPFIKSTAENAGSGGVGGSVTQKIGYGEDDSRLGGSLQQDTTPVFQAVTKEEQYWRIETKDIYTGKGWKQSRRENLQGLQNGRIPLETFSENVETEKSEAVIGFEPESFFYKLVYPYGIESVQGSNDVEMLFDATSEAVSIQGDQQSGLYNYRLTFENPTFSIDQLLEANGPDPEPIRNQYLQLPESLPQRVKELTMQVVKDEDTRYEKAKAVEQYFNQNGFEYSLEGVPFPSADQDYVDQFLFETKIGYCNNYSTSMAIMLRSIGIPTRWVKGFTSGEKVQEASGDRNVYQITNANAHSWVEVYFPNVGWVPFEPTQGFSNPMEFVENSNPGEDDETTSPEAEPTLGNQDTPEKPNQGLEMEDTGSKETESQSSNFLKNWWLWVLVGVILFSLVLGIYLKRYNLMSAFLLKKYQKQKGFTSFQDAYHYLLKVLDHKGLKRREEQTLREFATDVDRRFLTNEMSRLTYHYERTIYSKGNDDKERHMLMQLWQNLIKHALS